MVNNCCVHGCKAKYVKGGSVTFHCFPKDELRRAIWAKIVNRLPTKHSKICSMHFTEDCFDREKFGGTWLKLDAVPSLFDFASGRHMITYEQKPLQNSNFSRNPEVGHNDLMEFKSDVVVKEEEMSENEWDEQLKCDPSIDPFTEEMLGSCEGGADVMEHHLNVVVKEENTAEELQGNSGYGDTDVVECKFDVQVKEEVISEEMQGSCEDGVDLIEHPLGVSVGEENTYEELQGNSGDGDTDVVECKFDVQVKEEVMSEDEWDEQPKFDPSLDLFTKSEIEETSEEVEKFNVEAKDSPAAVPSVLDNPGLTPVQGTYADQSTQCGMPPLIGEAALPQLPWTPHPRFEGL